MDDSDYLVQLLLPVPSRHGRGPEERELARLRALLVDRFGGITTYQRSPAHGQWKEEVGADASKVEQDDVIVYEVMTAKLDRSWWRSLRQELEAALGQQELVIRAHRIESL
jgi:hypothetical protein